MNRRRIGLVLALVAATGCSAPRFDVPKEVPEIVNRIAGRPVDSATLEIAWLSASETGLKRHVLLVRWDDEATGMAALVDGNAMIRAWRKVGRWVDLRRGYALPAIGHTVVLDAATVSGTGESGVDRSVFGADSTGIIELLTVPIYREALLPGIGGMRMQAVVEESEVGARIDVRSQTTKLGPAGTATSSTTTARSWCFRPKARTFVAC